MRWFLFIMVPLIAMSSFGQDQDSTTIVEQDTIFDFPEIEAQYPGGMTAMYEYLYSKIEYPKVSASNRHCHDYLSKIFIEFLINPEGKVVNAKILKNEESPMAKSAMEAINSMPDWTPAKHNDHTVYQRFKLPIRICWE